MKSLEENLQQLCLTVPPWWDLENMVAVNPFMGLASGGLQNTEMFFQQARGLSALPDWSIFQHAFQKQEFSSDHLLPLQTGNDFTSEENLELKSICQKKLLEKSLPISMNADANLRSSPYRAHLTTFLAAYFDQGLSRVPWKKDTDLFSSWHEWASLDQSPEKNGIKGFRKKVSELPKNALAAREKIFSECAENLTDAKIASLLFEFPGWAGWIRKNAWEQSPEHLGQLPDFFTILLACHFICGDAELTQKKEPLATPKLITSEETLAKLMALSAWERAYRNSLHQKLNHSFIQDQKLTSQNKSSTDVQAVFCIDVRSEPYRKALENAIPSLETYGFAGFFAMPFSMSGSDGTLNQCPVLLKPMANWKRPEKSKKANKNILGSFRRSALGGFSFMELFGWQKAYNLFQGLFPSSTETVAITSQEMSEGLSSLPLTTKIDLAKGLLFHLALAKPYAPLVVFCGHEVQVENNPQSAGLACGACGGHSGAINAHIAAHLLNEQAVRNGLQNQDLTSETFFVASVHETCTDTMRILNASDCPASHQKALTQFISQVKDADHLARVARAPKIPGLEKISLSNHSVEKFKRVWIKRGLDWAETRPEWGLADNAAFIAAPRSWTKYINLEGRSFLNSYDPKNDPESKTLELILTAPLIVASWINLQYYASTTLPTLFGSGDKCLHTIVSGLGVSEGLMGDIRYGLALQSISDGKGLRHRPQRLQAFIADSRERVQTILDKHASLNELVLNGWITLTVMEDSPQNCFEKTSSNEWRKVIVPA